VGLLEFAPYGQETIRLDSGDTIIVFSDGVSEALSTSGEEFGDERLQAIAQATGQATAQTIVDRIVTDVRTFTKGAPQSDDITVMVIRYLGAGS
jgi:sigma-B regulation protein RsbU (phosphoserine phosphatase)